MNKLFSLGSGIAASILLSACCATSPYQAKYGPTSQPFHLNLHYGGTRECPSPLGASSHGPDVANWQRFLMAHHYGLLDGGPNAYKYPTGNFDKNTEQATMRFQASGCPARPIVVNGVVTIATFRKALRAGLPAYQPKPPLRLRAAIEGGPGPLTANDNFRDATLHLGCHNTPGTWNDVTDWQNFLIANFYIATGSGYPTGQFDLTTQGATMSFQADCGISVTGKVDTGTYSWANKFSTLGGFNLTGANGGPTVEKKINCQ
jgi:peptidoglycan hydrolase-like protein with peptidoglycan-binding domain